MSMRNQRGFTLLEILIVLVILAVLAGLAIPAYTTTVERSRAQEAYAVLSVLRESMQRYYAINGTYVGATFTPGNPGVTTIDYTPPTAGVQANGTTSLFTYSITGVPAANTYQFTATRTPAPPAPIGASTVVVDQSGARTDLNTGAYR